MSGIWWQMLFRDTMTGKWLGGINTEADTVADALNWTYIAGINPGGEVSFVGFRASAMDPAYLDRLITDMAEWTNQPRPTDPGLLPFPLPPELIGSRPTPVVPIRRVDPTEPGQD